MNGNKRPPDLARALLAMPPAVAVAVRQASAALTRAGVRHALCGGLAVSCYADPRATKDVDFLVGEEAFEHDGLMVSLKRGIPLWVGEVPIDTVVLVPKLRALTDSLAHAPHSEGVPVLSAEALAAMKLVAGRLRDQADVEALLASGAVDTDACRVFLRERFLDQLASFECLLEKAMQPDRRV